MSDKKTAIIWGSIVTIVGMRTLLTKSKSELEKCRTDCRSEFGWPTLNEPILLDCYKMCNQLDTDKLKKCVTK